MEITPTEANTVVIASFLKDLHLYLSFALVNWLIQDLRASYSPNARPKFDWENKGHSPSVPRRPKEQPPITFLGHSGRSKVEVHFAEAGKHLKHATTTQNQKRTENGSVYASLPHICPSKTDVKNKKMVPFDPSNSPLDENTQKWTQRISCLSHQKVWGQDCHHVHKY